MKPAAFTRHVPKTLDEALKILAEVAPQDGRILAGGQSLVPIMAFRMARPAHLVDINEVAGLDTLKVDGGHLSIGARVRHAAFHKPPVEGPLGALLASVVRHIAHYPIRMRGTFCGSLAHADPASEWCLTAATLDADLIAKSTRGSRTIAAKDFFEGIMSTALKDDELLTEPLRKPRTQKACEDVGRASGRSRDDPAHRPRRVGLCPSLARHNRQRDSTCCQMQKLSSVGKFHWAPNFGFVNIRPISSAVDRG